MLFKSESLRDILLTYKAPSTILFLLIFLCSLSETLGLGMIMPFLELITNPSSPDSITFMGPIIRKMPEEYSLALVGSGVAFFILVKNIFFVSKTAYEAAFVNRLRQTWSVVIMEKYLHAECAYHIAQHQGVLLNNLTREPAIAAKSILSIIELFSQLLLILLLYIMLLMVNWKVTLLVTICGGLLVGAVIGSANRYSFSVGKKQLSLNQEATAIGAESIQGIRQLKIFSFEKETHRRFAKKMLELTRIITKYLVVVNLPKAITESLAVLAIISVLLFFKYFVSVSILELVPTVGIFVIVMQRLIPAFSHLFSSAMNFNTYLPSLDLVYGLHRQQIPTEDLISGKPIHSLAKGIRLEAVCFRYEPEKELFDHLTFTIPRGETTALVGISGSGKSSVVNLLVGFYRPQAGDIFVNDVSLRDTNLQSWRSMIGYVSQEAQLFNGTVRENILMGKPDATEHEMQAAARKANAETFIISLTQGYDTPVGEMGMSLSGGQRQRIALARALIRDPEVLIFDEATSSLDSESERYIQDTISSFAGEKTVIIISHRLASVRRADRIIVFEKGRIIEHGSYEELVARKGRFSELAQG